MRHLPSVSWPPHVFRPIGLLSGGSVSVEATQALATALLNCPGRNELLHAPVTDGYVLRGCCNSDDDDDDWLLGYDAVCLSRNLPKCLYFRDSLKRIV